MGPAGQVHGWVLFDAAGGVLRPAILWNDQPTATGCGRITEAVGSHLQPGAARLTAPKLLWVRRHEPAIYARIAHVLLPKDHIRFRPTGGMATGHAGASGTLGLDVPGRRWSSDVLSAPEVPADWLPPAYKGLQATGAISPDAADETGLLPGTPMVAGAGDPAAQAVGVGAVRPGVLALTLGTSGVVFAPADEPVIEPQSRLQTIRHAVPGRWHLMGLMLSAGGSLRW